MIQFVIALLNRKAIVQGAKVTQASAIISVFLDPKKHELELEAPSMTEEMLTLLLECMDQIVFIGIATYIYFINEAHMRVS